MKKKSLLLYSALLFGCSGLSHADDVQKFYDDGYDLMVEFRKCSTIANQLGAEASSCLNKAESLIQSHLKSFEAKHKVAINRLSSPSNILTDKAEFVKTQKDNCQKLYPAPLQPTFKNLIKSCQVQVDLNRYMYMSNMVLGH